MMPEWKSSADQHPLLSNPKNNADLNRMGKARKPLQTHNSGVLLNILASIIAWPAEECDLCSSSENRGGKSEGGMGQLTCLELHQMWQKSYSTLGKSRCPRSHQSHL